MSVDVKSTFTVSLWNSCNIVNDFPPGELHASKTFSFSLTSRFIAAKYEDASWTINLPDLNSSVDNISALSR